MNNIKVLIPSSVGLILVAIAVSFATWTNSNIWIPISAILVILGGIVFAMRSFLSSIEDRLKKLEDRAEGQS